MGGCDEFAAMSRRRFMAVTGAGAAAAGALGWMPRVTMAKDYRGAQRDVLIVVFLRGGADGLTMCPPFLEEEYYNQRPTLAIPRPDSTSPYRAHDLNGTFGLAPALSPLLPLYQGGKLLFVHAAGSSDGSRSHFEAMRVIEVGRNGPTLPSGWLARHLLTTPAIDPGTSLRAIGISDSVPRSLAGATRVLPVPAPENFALVGNPITQQARYNALQSSYMAGREPARSYALNTIQTVSLLNNLDLESYQPAGGAAYPENRNGNAMRAAAALTKAQIGVEIIALDIGLQTWDTHQFQSPFNGALFNEMSNLASCLAAFGTDMLTGTAPSFTLVVMSEFGRSLIENGSRGTDHGHGGLMMVMGNAVNGNRVMTEWPGLGPGQLYDHRDLQVTIDYRDIMAEILEQRLGNTHIPDVFPGFTPTIRGVYA